VSSAPVQVLVLGCDKPRFDGSVLAQLARLADAGVVRLVDLLIVRRGEDGSLETVADGPEGYGGLAAAVLGDTDARDPPARTGTWSLAEVVPERGVVVVALIEHLWAAPLGAALQVAGVNVLEETWLAADDRALLASLESR
jgi:hypothetical protein